MFVKPSNWNKLTPEEKKKLRMDHWEKAEGVQFVSPEAEAKYRERAHRLRMAYDLAHPDRPIADFAMGSEYPIRRAGLTGYDILYNHEKLVEPIVQFNEEFQPDTAVIGFPYPGKVFDLLDLKTYDWGGHGLPKTQVIQMIEKEYMTPDEYPEFTMDPSGFFLKKYLGRFMGELAPLGMLADLPRLTEIVDVMGFVAPFGLPPVQEMFRKLLQAGDEMTKIFSVIGQMNLAGRGFPTMGAGFAKAPFDFLGDTLRGTKGIMMDMYRRPKQLLAACEAYVPILIKQLTDACDMTGNPCVMYPLHKGADGFMSQQQFETFYWPTFKAVLLGLWEEGIMGAMFVEGSYNSRLETIADMPKGSCYWLFDQSDMRRVKDCLADHATIGGNVPASVMQTGSPEKLRKVCDELVDLFSDAPGYILALGCGIETTTDEKVRIFLDSVKK